MSKKIKSVAIFICLLFLNFQFLNTMISASTNFYSIKKNGEVYRWLWEELSDAPGGIPGDDVVFWGESLGPYHNYTELTHKLELLNETFQDLVDVFSIGKTWHERDIWCVRLTNKSVTTAKTEFHVVGAHHAREMITVENCLYFIDRIVYESHFGLYEDLLSSTEIYVVPMLNPDGISIMHFFPEQRKNLRPIDDDEDGVNDTNSDGFLDDELERIYFWNTTSNISETIESDLDGDTFIAEDLPGGVDLNRNYGAYWFGNGSSPDKNSPTYRGEEPFSENETQAVRDFLSQHFFNFAVSLHSGIKAIISPWSHNGSLPLKDETEFNAILAGLKSATNYPLWNETVGYLSNGAWEDFAYASHDIFAFTLEVYETIWNGYYFDYFNPEGSSILDNSDQVFQGLEFLMYEPRLTYSNNLPTISVTNPSRENQVFENYTIRWTMDDLDGTDLNCTVLASRDGLHWTILATNLIDETYFFWDLEDEKPGSYYLKVGVSDGSDWVSDVSEIKLNVKQETEGSKFAFWLLASLFGALAAVFLYFNLRKTRGVSKIWGSETYEDEQDKKKK